MFDSILRHLLALSFFTLAAHLTSCAGPDPYPAAPETGTLTLNLRSDLNGTTFELRGATFEVIGENSLSIATDELPGASRIERELPAGDYGIELLPGWRLFEVGGVEDVEVSARLLTENPGAFSVTPAEVTPLSYRFEVSRGTLELAPGALAIEIDVQRSLQRAVVFNELMLNPAVLADTQGEWIELFNVGADPIDLNGCTLQRDATQITIAGALVIAPGGVVTLSNGSAPGFVPDYTYSRLTLPNSATFVLSLSCGDELLDSLTFDPKTFPAGNGIAASLSPAHATPDANDRSESWCNATTPYNGDLGTPGASNPSCS